MVTLRLKFPQISRLFSASTVHEVTFWSERVILWGLLLGCILYNAQIARQSQAMLPIYTMALSKPFSVNSHMTAATNLYNLGFIQSAKRELKIAQDLLTPSTRKVLGATNDPATLLSTWDSKPAKLTQEYMYWKAVTAAKPDYRDGFIYAASYAYQLGKTEEANSFLNVVYDLDPNFHLINLPQDSSR